MRSEKRIAWEREYHANPDVRKRSAIADKKFRSSEKRKKYMKEYNSSPEVKDRLKESVKKYKSSEKYKSTLKKYLSRPDVKERQKESSKKWRLNPSNRKKMAPIKRAINLKVKYGITMEEYDDILKSQNGLCAICLQKDKTGRRLAVDHCHDSGKVRGLLCMHCNLAVGMLRDDVKRAERLVQYIFSSIY